MGKQNCANIVQKVSENKSKVNVDQTFRMTWQLALHLVKIFNIVAIETNNITIFIFHPTNSLTAPAGFLVPAWAIVFLDDVLEILKLIHGTLPFTTESLRFSFVVDTKTLLLLYSFWCT